jgi:hypothetical protein
MHITNLTFPNLNFTCVIRLCGFNNWTVFTDFSEIWYRRYAIGDYSKIVLCNFSHSVISTWRLPGLRWSDDDAITYDPLRMRITNLTYPNQTWTSPVISACAHLVTRQCRRDFNEIWYGRYAMGDYSKIIVCNFPYSVIPTWRLLEVVRWSDDAITHDPLRMLITSGIHIDSWGGTVMRPLSMIFYTFIMTSSSLNTQSGLMDICGDVRFYASKNRERLNGFSWLFLWTLLFLRLIKIVHINVLYLEIPIWRMPKPRGETVTTPLHVIMWACVMTSCRLLRLSALR